MRRPRSRSVGDAGFRRSGRGRPQGRVLADQARGAGAVADLKVVHVAAGDVADIPVDGCVLNVVQGNNARERLDDRVTLDERVQAAGLVEVERVPAGAAQQ